ncbi:hypothetical protein VB777_10650 [Synechococcus sp. CCY9202]|nr:hypothetical protein [Synechococcus sp. CCY9202]
MHELRPEEADVPGGGLNMAEMAILEKVAALDAVGNKLRIRDAGDGLELGGSFRSEALVCINVKKPCVLERDVPETPVLMRCPIVEGALDDARARIGGNLLGAIRAAGVVDDNIRAPSNGLKTSRKILLFILG